MQKQEKTITISFEVDKKILDALIMMSLVIYNGADDEEMKMAAQKALAYLSSKKEELLEKVGNENK